MSLRLVRDPLDERLRAGLERLDRALRHHTTDTGTVPAVLGLDDTDTADADVIDLLAHRLTRTPQEKP